MKMNNIYIIRISECIVFNLGINNFMFLNISIVFWNKIFAIQNKSFLNGLALF